LESGTISAETEEDLTNETLELGTTLENDLILSEEERKIISQTFSETTIKTTKAELVNDRIIIRYELGKYWIEYSYDSSITDEELEFLMETDRIKFLKDLASKSSQEKNRSQKLDELIVDHEIFSEEVIQEEN